MTVGSPTEEEAAGFVGDPGVIWVELLDVDAAVCGATAVDWLADVGARYVDDEGEAPVVVDAAAGEDTAEEPGGGEFAGSEYAVPPGVRFAVVAAAGPLLDVQPARRAAASRNPIPAGTDL